MNEPTTPFAERLSTLDEAFLSNETETCPMHVGAVMVLDDGPLKTESGGVDFDAIVAFIAGALPQEPRFTQRLRSVPGLPDHVWVDDAHFDIHYHVRHTALPRPGDERQLKRLAGRIFSLVREDVAAEHGAEYDHELEDEYAEYAGYADYGEGDADHHEEADHLDHGGQRVSELPQG